MSNLFGWKVSKSILYFILSVDQNLLTGKLKLQNSKQLLAKVSWQYLSNDSD